MSRPLPPSSDADTHPRSLYVHVPFCPHICPYCDFHKMRRNEDLVSAYLDRLEAELGELGASYGGPLDTLYLGGGTPSHLTDHELGRLFAAVHDAFGGNARRETTLEADPRTFDAQRLGVWRSLGITRLSIGVQSLQDPVLTFLGRRHDAASAREAVHLATGADLDVSVDLILSVPGQNTRADLEAMAALDVGHISVYTLTIEPWTPFARRKVKVDEDRAADDYAEAARILTTHGYHRYEVSNHARPGREALHNSVYWHGAPFLAAGPSAAAYLPSSDGFGIRVTNPPIKGWLAHTPPEREPLDATTYLLERLMTGLRTSSGVDLDALARRTGIDPFERFATTLEESMEAGWLVLEPAAYGGHVATQGRRLRATNAGLLVLDAILRRFFSA